MATYALIHTPNGEALLFFGLFPFSAVRCMLSVTHIHDFPPFLVIPNMIVRVPIKCRAMHPSARPGAYC